jgi:hypothetical protein
MQDVERYGTPVVSQLVYARTKEQRDFWKERAEGLEKANLILAAKIERLQKILTEARNALTQSDASAEAKS